MSATQNLKEEHQVILRTIKILIEASDKLERELGIDGGKINHEHH